MPNVSTLTVRISANSARLVKELDRAGRKARTFKQKMVGSLSVIGRAFGRMAGVAAVALTAVAVAAIKSADQIGKLVDRLGATTEAFSELKFVAERSGIAFNTLTMGLQRMQRRVAEAAAGFGEAKDALYELGLDAVALNKIPLDKQFEVVADAMSKVANEADRTRLTMKLFESEGVALRSGAHGYIPWHRSGCCCYAGQ